MDAPKIRLLADRVLVTVPTKKEEAVTASGIILPNTDSDEKAMLGIVLRVSVRVTDCEVEADKVAVGEQVLFSKFAGTDVEYKNKSYKVLRITDIIGAVEE